MLLTNKIRNLPENSIVYTTLNGKSKYVIECSTVRGKDGYVWLKQSGRYAPEDHERYFSPEGLKVGSTIDEFVYPISIDIGTLYENCKKNIENHTLTVTDIDNRFDAKFDNDFNIKFKNGKSVDILYKQNSKQNNLKNTQKKSKPTKKNKNRKGGDKFEH